jgi:hypothetical protein
MMNSPLVLEASRHTAELVLAGCAASDERQLLDRLYTRILGRPPQQDEIEPSLALVHAALFESFARESADSESATPESTAEASARLRAWSILSHALFCSTNFQYLD